MPTELPPLELKATHGLVSPEEFKVPPISTLWSGNAYTAFDLTKTVLPAEAAKTNKAAVAAEGDLEPVKEKPSNATAKDQKNNSGCVLQ